MAKNLFNSIKLSRPRTNHFDLTHDVKLSLNMGNLTPIMCMECVPGDRVNISCDSLLRFAPLVAPVMHRMDVTMHYFFVPNRILWPNWEKFITNDESAPAHPFMELKKDEYDTKPVLDYLGLPSPPTSGDPIIFNALPVAAYNKIYNEYYRDQNLIDPLNDVLTDGNNNSNLDLGKMQKRAWEHDYFTSALPFAQKGASVDIPLGDVVLKEDWGDDAAASGVYPKMQNPDGSTSLPGDIVQDAATGGNIQTGAVAGTAYDPAGTLETASTTIESLRRAFRLQEWLEKAARGGSRYVENILVFFGVKSPDARLQRPEYITGTKSPVVISEIVNTTGGVDAPPQGNMAGHGISVTTGRAGSYFCQEHGYIIGIMSVMPKTAYQQGIPKHFLKSDPFDYFWPQFAHIGEQEVQNQEVWVDNPVTFPYEDVFGYVPRYAEYKFLPNRVAGEFKTSLNHWHLGRIFDTAPNLNKDFIECNPTSRVFAVTSEEEQKLYCHVLNRVSAFRPMPKFGTPTF